VVAVVYVAAMFMSVLDTTIVTVALPAIARDFDVSAASVGAVSIAYLLALTVFIPASGWLGDRIGGKRALLGAIGLFTLGSALCGCAGSLPMLVALSALQGVGGAVMLPVGLAMLFRAYPPAERVRLSGTLALVTAIGPALGPLLGGVFTSYATWRLVFFVNVPIGLAALVWGALRLDAHTQPRPGRLDLAGLVLSAVGLGVSALVSGLTSIGSAVGVVLGGQLVSRVLYARVGPRRLTAAGLVLIALSLALMARITAADQLWWARLDLFVLGLGVAAVSIPSQAISMATISRADTGRASPVFNAGKQLGSAVGVALLSTVVGSLIGSRPGAAASARLFPYHVAFLTAAAVALAAVAVALVIRDADAAATMSRPMRPTPVARPRLLRR
jgi:MFS family permease